jgi:hypothetical protein
VERLRIRRSELRRLRPAVRRLGRPLGSEFHVNTYTTNDQTFASVGADSAGNFVVVWTSYFQDGSDRGIFGQRYSEILPVDLTRFDVE